MRVDNPSAEERARAGGTGAGSCAPVTLDAARRGRVARRRDPVRRRVPGRDGAAGRSPAPTAGVDNRADDGRRRASDASRCARPAAAPVDATVSAGAAGARRARARRLRDRRRRHAARCGRPSTRTSTTRSSPSRRAAASSRSTRAASACATCASRDGRLVPQRRTAAAARRVDPGGRARPRPGAARRRTSSRSSRELKALGANVTRAQYPLDERLLDAPRRGGHPRLEPGAGLPPDRLLETAERRRRGATRRCAATVLDARSHPSVMTHSVANELSAVPGHDARHARASSTTRATLAARPRPTVPAARRHCSATRASRAQDAYARFGLLGINSYYGWYHGKTDHSTANLAGLAPFLERMRRMYPRQAQVITEFGAESTSTGPRDVKETFAFQSRYVDATLRDRRRAAVAVAARSTGRCASSPSSPTGTAAPSARRPRDAHPQQGPDHLRRDAASRALGRRRATDFAATPLYRTAPRTALAATAGGGGLGPSAASRRARAPACWRCSARDLPPAPGARHRCRADARRPTPLRRELDGDHVAVGASRSRGPRAAACRGRARRRSRRRRPARPSR